MTGPAAGPARPGLVPLRKLIADTARAVHGTDDGTEWAPLTAEVDDDAAELIAAAVLTWMEAAGPARPGDEDTAPREDVVDFLLWLVSMDDPEDIGGREARRTVTLTRIIERARAALMSTANAVPSVPPQPTVPRAPVEALLAALKDVPPQYRTATGAAVAEVRRHLNGDTA